ncbi:MAG: TIGR02611 family protein [Pseudonocardiaceae bacterium]
MNALDEAVAGVDRPAGADDGNLPSPPRGRYAMFRERMRCRPGMDRFWRCGVGMLGAVVLAAGIIMIPYPGPGWLIVFVGLAILGTEFAWAKRLLDHARARYDRWNAWQRRQHGPVRVALLAATAGLVLLTLWILGALGFAARLLGLDWPLLDSPLGPLA